MSGKASSESYTHRYSTKLYIPSTINTEKEMLSPGIQADKKWAGFWQAIACTSNNPQMLRYIKIYTVI